MPFQKGNKAAVGGRKEKPWRDALMLAVKDEKIGNGQALRKIAEACVEAAIDGCKDARTEIANRLDGKPVQATELTGEDGGPIETTTDSRDMARAILEVLREAQTEKGD